MGADPWKRAAETLPFLFYPHAVARYNGGMETHSATASDIERILRDKQQEFAALMQAIAEQEPDIDLKIASLVEGESEDVKLGIVEHVREMVREREEQKARDAGLARSAEQKRAMEEERTVFKRFLIWLMSETTLKKIKLAALIPILQRQGVKDIGAELAAKGVTLNPSLTNRKELGQLSALTQQAKDKERDSGRGR